MRGGGFDRGLFTSEQSFRDIQIICRLFSRQTVGVAEDNFGTQHIAA